MPFDIDQSGFVSERFNREWRVRRRLVRIYFGSLAALVILIAVEIASGRRLGLGLVTLLPGIILVVVGPWLAFWPCPFCRHSFHWTGVWYSRAVNLMRWRCPHCGLRRPF
jgi:hypothetical protein